jgi:surfeit locus 1 family protein
MSSGPSRIGRGLLMVALLFVGAGFTALGVWQVERRTWKLQLLAAVDERVHAAPTAPPGPSQWSAISAASDAYRHVRVRGILLHDRETLVQALTEQGSGFWVVTPLREEDGSTVLINRGFVPPERQAPASRQAGLATGAVTVTGLLRMTEPKGGFLRKNDPGAGRWYSRDVAAIAHARRLERVAPYFIDADAGPDATAYPIGGLTVITFPNNHLSYALTWFALAIMTLGGLVVVARHGGGGRQGRGA